VARRRQPNLALFNVQDSAVFGGAGERLILKGIYRPPQNTVARRSKQNERFQLFCFGAFSCRVIRSGDTRPPLTSMRSRQEYLSRSVAHRGHSRGGDRSFLVLDRIHGTRHVWPHDWFVRVDDDAHLGFHSPSAAFRDVGRDDDWHDAAFGHADSRFIRICHPQESAEKMRPRSRLCVRGRIPVYLERVQPPCDGFAVTACTLVTALINDGSAKPLVRRCSFADRRSVPVHAFEAGLP
jgi:hypothetical protein